MLFKTAGQVGFEPVDLDGELADHGDQGSHRGAHGFRDQIRCGELFGAQGLLDLDSPFLDPPLAAAPARTASCRRFVQIMF